MRPNVTAKLFLTMLASCALVVLIHGLAGRIAFQRGFMDYLNEQGVQRMQEILPRLRQEWREQGGWQRLQGDLSALGVLMRPAAPSSDDADALRVPPLSDQTGAIFRMALLHPDYRLVTGNPEAGARSILLPVEIDGATVGWLAMVPFEQALIAGDVRFYEAQLRAWWIIGICSVLLAAVLAGLLARALLRPLRSVTHAVRRLAEGDFATRVPVSTRDELGVLAQSFNLLAQGLGRNESARRSLMADVSHELRTPLAVMRADLEAMQDGISPVNAEALAALHQQVGQLGQLVDDLHELSLTDAGTLAYRHEPIDLAAVVRASVAGMAARFEAAGLAFQADVPAQPLRLVGDEQRLQQLLANLLNNALRYTDRGGQVRLHGERGDAHWLRLTLEDSAPGVAEDKLSHLFERFYRADASRNRSSGGSGLGLAICRNIVEAHGGRITATASPLGGLCITVELPEAA
ncbi:sensor histidine kinase efflux regulator BaeS [Corticibacter populi]|uniref:histidine kinase n=1 Tax=Corticibacter populi TaxID=1550736 RepID=A0A3M6QXM0_9BURK|nr:sensor histidine kinase efflux regulator BaeS [Corticibacter populi]RMX07724.1 sensor histidine kinase efflux regulator BaeS [Corticibacter populi]RZS30240.1 two-component system sensor histidine kinase BaeS [Corticibacter populi]